ncbi:ATP-binding protein [Flavihumibacter rivuli]|uniref:sensor histidine kinase n=1 Tax=Flavihumibacter rivuli TaxID=2838156 RepID=UPI001BDEDBA9|nr:ATP-binding protein [Flavihumibacter rivuli]ULQ56673.1 ATP-binding protein [Flavihumibacter rivuli]
MIENEFQSQILRTRIEVQEETINNVAKEIHDNVNQALTFSKLNLNLLNYQDLNGVKTKISYTSDLITEAISSLSNLSKSLNADFLKDIGLVSALEMEVDKVNRMEECKAVLKINGTHFQLSFEKELVIFRITQEAIRNAISHGQAKQITIQIVYHHGVTIEITDNGKGFDTSVSKNQSKTQHQGLINMKKRASIIGAHIEILSKPQEGTLIKLEIPS